MTLRDQISDALSSSGSLGDLARDLGTTSTEADSLVGAGVPAILASLGAHSGGDGMDTLMGLINDDGGNFVDHLGSFFSRGDTTGLASKLVGALFGSKRSAIETQVAERSGTQISTVSRLLPLLAPAVIGVIAKRVTNDKLDREGLAAELAASGADGPYGDTIVASIEEDGPGFGSGITELREAGGLAALVPAPAASVAPLAGAAASGAGAAVTAVDAPVDDNHDRTGLGWLPAVVLPVIALITGLILWQCTSSTSAEVAEEIEEVAVVEPTPEAEPEPEPEPEPTEAPAAEPTAAPEPTPTPEPEPTPEPTAAPAVTIADLALGTPELSTLVDIAVDLDLVGPLSDPDGGPFTVFAPTNDAFASAESLLARLDGDQTRTTVTYHVVPAIVTAADLTPGATFDTLAGETLTVDDDGTLTGGIRVATADIEADNGVVHIIESVLVPGSINRALAAEDVNQAFELNPIQFDLGSADILAASEPTLDEAITTLTSLPEGTVFEVQGHTDSQGDEALNQALSEARAASVVAYLVDGGVDADMLAPVGYGESELLVDPEITPEDFAANRRIEFVDITTG